MSNEYRNNMPPERVQVNLKALKEAYEANTVGRRATTKPRDNMADVIIAKELDSLVCLASAVEETAQRRLAPVSFGCPTSPEECGLSEELPPLFNNYRNQIARVQASLRRIEGLIENVQISEP